MNNEDLKKLIAAKAIEEIDELVKEFCETEDGFREELLAAVSNPENWVWHGSNEDGTPDVRANLDDPENWKPRPLIFPIRYHSSHLERCFDCEPMDDQLRAYVETDMTDTNILNMYITGE